MPTSPDTRAHEGEPVHPLTHAISASHAADHAWQAALVARYGRHARDARYDTRGIATPELARLHAVKRETADAEHAEWERHRAREALARKDRP